MKYFIPLLLCFFSNILYGQNVEKLLNEAHTLEVSFKENAALEKYLEVQWWLSHTVPFHFHLTTVQKPYR